MTKRRLRSSGQVLNTQLEANLNRKHHNRLEQYKSKLIIQQTPEQ